MQLYRQFGKRLLDVTAATFGFLALAPLLALLALLVRAKLGSPVLFRQTRPGLHGRPFELIYAARARPAAASTSELMRCAPAPGSRDYVTEASASGWPEQARP